MEPKEPQLGAKKLAEIDPEIKIIDGKIYREIDSGYTIREYFSHETSSKGPGPGWDTRWDTLRQYGVYEPSELPNEPYIELVEIRTQEQVHADLMKIEKRIMDLKAGSNQVDNANAIGLCEFRREQFLEELRDSEQQYGKK
ncbi:MAG: hypothetical protein WCV69_00330 [Patescibacteria group bacterium]|jgi:hypothetical protein